jgi:ligand-binding sensor domain-containing protein
VASREGGIYRRNDDGGWTRFDRSDGLPSNQVFDLMTDAAGAVWACTAGGPARFDGVSWHTAELPESISIPQCLDIALAPDGGMWAATLRGVLRWDGSAWTGFARDDGLPSSVITTVQPARDGVWVTTPGGFGYWDGSSWKTLDDSDLLPAHGLSRYNAFPYASPYDEGIYLAPGDDPDADAYSTDFQRVAPDGTREVYFSNYAFKAKTVAVDGTVYVGTEFDGLFVIGATVQRIAEFAGEPVFRVGELWAAPDGTVWMDTAVGLFEIRPNGEMHRHLEVAGLGYALTASDEVGDFADGTLLGMEFGPDGSVWAISNDRGGRLGNQ